MSASPPPLGAAPVHKPAARTEIVGVIPTTSALSATGRAPTSAFLDVATVDLHPFATWPGRASASAVHTASSADAHS